MERNTNSKIYGTTILVLVVATIFFGYQYFALKSNLGDLQESMDQFLINEKTLEFTRIFVSDVLNADGVVDNKVRRNLDDIMDDIGDEELGEVWERLENSEDENEARDLVVDLLRLLSEKIQTVR